MIVNLIKYIELLVKSGFTRSQAEALVQVIVEIINQEKQNPNH